MCMARRGGANAKGALRGTELGFVGEGEARGERGGREEKCVAQQGDGRGKSSTGKGFMGAEGPSRKTARYAWTFNTSPE